MSIIHLNQIRNQVHKLFDGKINLTDVVSATTNAEQAENFFLSRGLAAYALHYLAGVDPSVAAGAVTDGGDDNGIDAILNVDADRRLYIVQSKWIHSGVGEPENGDIKKFVAGVRDLFNLQWDRFNSKIKAKERIVRTALSDPNTRYEIVVVYTGINRLAEPSTRDLNDLALEMNDASELLSVSPLNQTDLYGSLAAGISGEPINLEIGVRAWGRVEALHPAYYGQVDGGQIASWWTKYRSRLFTKNLRGVLGDTEVNDEIRTTIDKNPDLFWYFNNGITLTAKKVAKTMMGGGDTGFGTFHCSDVSIVNGAQTVGAIGKYAAISEEKVKKLFVPFRVISLESSDVTFGETVTKTNNRQNRIENRDFVSLDPEQNRLKTELAVEGIQYHLMRSETTTKGSTAFDLIDSTTALACGSGDVALVVQLKREIGKLWENLERGPYKQLFNASMNGIYVWRCVQLQRLIDEVMEQLAASALTKGGREYGVAVHGNRIVAALTFAKLNPKPFADPAFDFKSALDPRIVAGTVQKVYESLLREVTSRYANAIIPTLFKNQTKCKDLYGRCL
jgi:hypothetical protein